MNNKDALYFDDKLWSLIRKGQENSSMDKDKKQSLSKFADLMNKEGFDCNKNTVDRALTRLEEKGKIKRKWTGSYYITTALLEVYVDEDVEANRNAWINRKQRQAPPIAYEIMDYLKMNGVGLNQSTLSDKTNMAVMAKKLDITERTLRLHIENLVFDVYLLSNGKVFDRLINGDQKNGGYFLVTNDDELSKMLAEWDLQLYTVSKKRSIIRRKAGLDNQMNMTFTDFEKEYRKSISSDLVKKKLGGN